MVGAPSLGIDVAEIAWRMDLQTYEHYLNLYEEISSTHPDYEFEKYQELLEEFQQLDGFPRDYDPEYDVIIPVINDQPIVVSVPRQGRGIIH